MFLVHNWTETTLLRSRETLWNLFVVFAVVYPLEWTGRANEDHHSAEELRAEAGDEVSETEVVATRPQLAGGGTENADFMSL
jgi:hypothetical protein